MDRLRAAAMQIEQHLMQQIEPLGSVLPQPSLPHQLVLESGEYRSRMQSVQRIAALPIFEQPIRQLQQLFRKRRIERIPLGERIIFFQLPAQPFGQRQHQLSSVQHQHIFAVFRRRHAQPRAFSPVNQLIALRFGLPIV